MLLYGGVTQFGIVFDDQHGLVPHIGHFVCDVAQNRVVVGLLQSLVRHMRCCLLDDIQKVLLFDVGLVLLRGKDLRNDVLIAPVLRTVGQNGHHQLVSFDSDCIDPVISQPDKGLQNLLIEVGFGDQESLEDLDDLALVPPVVGGQLLDEGLDDLFIKDILVGPGGEVLEVLSNPEGNLVVGLPDEVEYDGQKTVLHELG